jgi:D-sedoheptulose 7-phosphate isomerase
MDSERIKSHFTEAAAVLSAFMDDANNITQIVKAGDTMVECLKNGGKIMSCGNGGSHCDAMHFAEELSGRYRNNRKAMAAMAISDPSHISCVGNDYGYEFVFSRFIEGLGKPGDVLLAISTSGNSRNVIEAIQTSKAMGITTVALTGKDGGQIGSICDIEIRAPHSPYADRAQEIHIKIIHSLIDFIESQLVK